MNLKRLKLVVQSLHDFEVSLRGEPALRNETRAIREAFYSRLDSFRSMKQMARRQRLPKPKPAPMIIELFLPAEPSVGEPAETRLIDLNDIQDVRWMHQMSDAYSGRF